MNEERQHPTTSPSSGSRSRRRMRLLRGLPITMLLVLALAACSIKTSSTSTPGSTSTSTATTTTATSTPAASSSSSTATATSTPATSTPAAVATSSPTGSTTTTTSSTSGTPTSGTTPTSDVVAAVKQVIQQANQEQIQALAKNDPTLMKDTTTSAGYLQFQQDLQSLTGAGVTSIDLKDLKWGNITQVNATTVKVTTIETWDATQGNSVTQQQADTNVYTLVLVDGNWKITSDDHPDSSGGQTTSSPGTQPGTTSTIPVDSLSQSENWAGYAATGGTFTSVSGTWTVPTVDATSADGADATWVGIGGVASTDLIQAGTEAIVQGQQVSYSAWIETLPQSEQQISLTVSPGDKVSVTIDQQSTGVWQILMKDLTTGQTYQKSVNYNSTLSSAEWIEESPSAGWAQVPLDNFGTVSFSNATAVENGQSVSINQANGHAITMAARNGQALAQTSDLGSDGSSFSVTRTNVSSSQYPSGGRSFQRGYPGAYPQN